MARVCTTAAPPRLPLRLLVLVLSVLLACGDANGQPKAKEDDKPCAAKASLLFLLLKLPSSFAPISFTADAAATAAVAERLAAAISLHSLALSALREVIMRLIARALVRLAKLLSLVSNDEGLLEKL